jgi:glycosyltransferase involved in cell wall biosynthesis
MNILYTNFHSADGGGHTTYILTLMKHGRRNAFVACPPASMLYSTLSKQGCDRLIPIDFPGKPKHFREIAKNALLLRQAIALHDIDIVHTNGSNDNRMALYVSLFTRKKFKVVFTKHNTIPFNNPVSRLRLNAFNDAVIFVGDFLDYLGLDRNNPRYHIIPNGIDTAYWRRTAPRRADRRLTLISIAGASRHKGWQHLMEAIAGLESAEKSRLKVALLARHEEEMAKELASAGSICDFHFPGFLRDVRPELEKADIGFVLSYKEACSFSVREMMSMGLPLITSDFMTLVRDIDESCGWVTRMKDPESIRETLRVILAMPPERLSAMQTAARRKAEAEFSVRSMIERTDAVYARLMGEAEGVPTSASSPENMTPGQ